jgi:hypothetical protein
VYNKENRENWLVLYTDSSVDKDLIAGFEDAALNVFTKSMNYALLDCAEDGITEICKEHNITSVPDVRYF